MKANLLSCLLRFQQTFRSGSAERDRESYSTTNPLQSFTALK